MVSRTSWTASTGIFQCWAKCPRARLGFERLFVPAPVSSGRMELWSLIVTGIGTAVSLVGAMWLVLSSKPDNPPLYRRRIALPRPTEIQGGTRIGAGPAQGWHSSRGRKCNCASRSVSFVPGFLPTPDPFSRAASGSLH